MDIKSFQTALQQIAEEKGLDPKKVLETIEMAISAAYKKDYGKKGQIIRAHFDPKTGGVEFKQIKIIVDESMLKTEEEIEKEEQKKLEEAENAAFGRRPRHDDEDDEPIGEEHRVRFNPEKHIMIDEAKKIKKDASLGDEIEFSLESHIEYGRIAAQTAKQVIIQRIREAERSSVFQEFKSKEGEIVNGSIQRIEGRTVFVDIGRTIAILPPEEKIPFENYRIGERIKCLIVAVEENPKGPGIFLSRSHPKLLKKLFEIEVPEIASRTVEIKSVAREPGSRSKLTVMSHEDGVDPVGSLVGQKGVRVMAVINELGGEKIDIIEWSEDPARLIANALSPAKALSVELNTERKEAQVVVPDQELSLAIGKRGQNVRLAAKLTGWKIDLRSDAKPEEPIETGEAPQEALAESAPETVSEEPTAEKSVESEPKAEKKSAEEKPKKKRKAPSKKE